ncbi:MAG: ribonuclease [Flavobacteriaceae bacterium]|nr:MAG: ribonuclease [Flavobacteriaceae bacterium]
MKKTYLVLSLAVLLAACGGSDDNVEKEEEVIIEEELFQIPDQLKDYYATIDFSGTDEELYDDLATLTIAKHTNFLEYWQRHSYLYKADKDPNNEANVILLYSGESRNKMEYSSSSNSYSPQTFNTEHVYPKSKLSDEHSLADMHHLRVCDSDVNTKRYNYHFTDGTGDYKLINYDRWYPGDEWRGDVARMILYVNLRYDEPLNGDISTSGINLFLKWNIEDPVSAIEIQRNNVIEDAQGNRNPFIDNPYLVTLLYGGDAAENKWAE